MPPSKMVDVAGIEPATPCLQRVRRKCVEVFVPHFQNQNLPLYAEVANSENQNQFVRRPFSNFVMAFG
jgi:hypothetical protein